jgi:hypothetical protein
MKRMSGKVEKITSWQQLIEKPKVGKAQIRFADGSWGEIEVKSLSKAEVDEINEMWDAQKPAQPTDYLKVPGKAPQQITLTEGEQYEKWKTDCQAIDNLKIAHTALKFLVISPEPAEGLVGIDAIKDQIKQLNAAIGFGNFAEIIKQGYIASGINFDEQVENAKNF